MSPLLSSPELEADLFDSAQRLWWMVVAGNKEAGKISENSQKERANFISLSFSAQDTSVFRRHVIRNVFK